MLPPFPCSPPNMVLTLYWAGSEGFVGAKGDPDFTINMVNNPFRKVNQEVICQGADTRFVQGGGARTWSNILRPYGIEIQKE